MAQRNLLLFLPTLLWRKMIGPLVFNLIRMAIIPKIGDKIIINKIDTTISKNLLKNL